MSKYGIIAEPTLVGREKELEELQSLLNAAKEGKGKTVFVSGEAGSGKTRLVTEFLKTVKKSDITVLTGWCLSNAAVPYFPFFEAFNAFFTKHEENAVEAEKIEVKSLLKGLTQTESVERLPVISPQVWKDQAFLAVSKTLSSISRRKPIILFIDDMHWADSASLALIHYIARCIVSERVLLLASYRSEELTSDAEGHPHPLAETLRTMRREDLFTEIILSSLSRTSVAKMAENMIGGSLQQEFAEKLARESRGNPLFVIESLRMLHERKILLQENNEWRLSIGELGVPNKIKAIILRRLASLKYGQRRVLDAASVIGEEFNAELLSTVLGQDTLEVLEALNVIAQSTSIVCVEEAFYRFDHATSREVLYEALSLPLKRGYHARIAERLEALSESNRLSFADLAYHYAQAQNEEKAVKYALAAGKEELSKWSNTEAVKHFQYVLQKIGDNPEQFNERMIALEGLGDAYYASDIFSQAVNVFDQLANLQSGVAKLRALRKASLAASYKGDVQKFISFTQKAEENAAADRLESARVLDQKARILVLQGQYAAALGFEEKALRIFEEEYSLADVAYNLISSSLPVSTQGQLEKGIAYALRSIALLNELGDVRYKAQASFYLGYVFDICMLNQEADDAYAKVIEINEQLKLVDYVALISAYVAWGVSRPPDAIADGISKTLKALEYSEKTDSYLFLGWIYDTLVLQYSVAGDMVHADEYFGKLMSLPQEAFIDGTTKIWLGLAKAAYFAGKNQFEESNRFFKDYFEFIKAFPNPLIELLTRRAYAWALSKQGRVDEVKTQLEQMQSLIETTPKRFSHANVQASLITFTHPEINQMFEIRLDLINVSKSQGSIVKVENLGVPGLKIIDVSPNCLECEGTVEVKDKLIEPFEVKTIRLAVKAAKLQEFHLNPTVTYVDDLGETRTSSTRPFIITVQPAKPTYEVLAGRVTTGTKNLDRLLLGGIPAKYAVVLIASSSDERQKLIRGFIEAGAINHETTIYLTCEALGAEELARAHQDHFYVGVCNPQVDSVIPNLPNVIKFRGTENLTEIDISLAKLLRTVNPAHNQPRRVCIDLLSDALLQHHAVATRRWLSGLIAMLKSNGFTVLAVVDPLVLPEEVPAITGLFDGEIEIYEERGARDRVKSLRVLKLQGQNYLKDEVPLG